MNPKSRTVDFHHGLRILPRMRAAMTLWLMSALVLVPGPPASASPLRIPKRTINGQTVSLNPLFQWWTNHHGTRPLSAWVHVTGPVVGTNGWGWIVEAQIENTDRPNKPESPKDAEPVGPAKILLRNPPLRDRAEFEKLSAQLKALHLEHTTVAGQETQAKKRADALASEQNANRRNRVQAGALAQASRRSRQVEDEAKVELKSVDRQIQELKTKLAAYPNSDHYVLDCFALDTGQEQSQMRIYDHGWAAQ